MPFKSVVPCVRIVTQSKDSENTSLCCRYRQFRHWAKICRASLNVSNAYKVYREATEAHNMEQEDDNCISLSSNHSRFKLNLPNSLRFWLIQSPNSHLGFDLYITCAPVPYQQLLLYFAKDNMLFLCSFSLLSSCLSTQIL